jgi:hypothetical protein
MKKNINLSINSLILFTVWLIIEKKEKCSFQRLVKDCFELFPETFSLEPYSLPDSRKLDRPLRFLKAEKSIKVNSTGELSLTKKGLIQAQEVNKILRQEKLKI